VLRDPGRLLTSRDQVVAAGRPFTQLVAHALEQRGAHGAQPQVLVEPYRDALGREVVGAWVWLEDLDVGLATEVEADLIFASLHQIERVEQLLVGLVVLLSLLAFYSSRSAEVLTTQVEDSERLGQYELLEQIGEGGSGRIFKARHAMLERLTAIKLIRPEVMSEAARERFAREARLASRLTHPNTIVIYDYGCSDQGTFYYAMEFLEGETLAQLLKREGHVPVERAVHILRQVLGSLAEAHACGLVHRDIKPQNIMLTRRAGEDDIVKVLDFGLVKAFEGAETEDVELTAQGMVGGTPLYIAPDRYAGASEVDGRTDLYAVGTLAYRMLTGRAPFEGTTRVALSLAVMNDPVPHVTEHSRQLLPRALDELIYSAMAKSPNDRPPSARAMIEALDALGLGLGRRSSTE
jgi:serine/threonine-protein kinase